MQAITTVGLDIAKSVFQVHGVDGCHGVGPALATALVASVADPKAFGSGRRFAAWIGLVPNQYSSGGKEKLGNISKRGDRYLRSLFHGGRAGGDPLCQDPRHQPQALAQGIVDAPAHQGRRDRACQQDRTDSLGPHGQGRTLQGTRRARGVRRSRWRPGVT